MLRRIIICDHREKLIATLDTILKHWGYRVLSVVKAENALELLEEISPHLLLISTRMILNHSQLRKRVFELASIGDTKPIMIIDSSDDRHHFKECEYLTVPFDIFELFSLVQKHLEKIPRRNLRLDTTLPGLLCIEGSCQLVDVLSLSSHGLFIKTSIKIESDQETKMILPLLGLKREVEIPCRIIYTIQPCIENNFLQGFGVEFVSPTTDTLELIRQFLEQRLLGEIVTKRVDASDLEIDQMLTRSDEAQLRLIMRKHS